MRRMVSILGRAPVGRLLLVRETDNLRFEWPVTRKLPFTLAERDRLRSAQGLNRSRGSLLAVQQWMFDQ